MAIILRSLRWLQCPGGRPFIALACAIKTQVLVALAGDRPSTVGWRACIFCGQCFSFLCALYDARVVITKKLVLTSSGRNAAINLEYLKNCVVGCLRTSEPSEHARLLPVITTILKLSREEADVIAKNISTRAQHQGSFGGSLPPGADADGGGGGGSGGSWWNKAKPPRR